MVLSGGCQLLDLYSGACCVLTVFWSLNVRKDGVLGLLLSVNLRKEERLKNDLYHNYDLCFLPILLYSNNKFLSHLLFSCLGSKCFHLLKK